MYIYIYYIYTHIHIDGSVGAMTSAKNRSDTVPNVDRVQVAPWRFPWEIGRWVYGILAAAVAQMFFEPQKMDFTIFYPGEY